MIKFYTKFIQQLAKRYIARHKPMVIGVTGSAGKSSAVTAIGAVLTQLLSDQKVYFPSKQLNGELGMPLTIFQIEYFGPTIKYILTTTWKVLQHYWSQTKPYDIIVLEYGVDHVGEMDVLIDITRPDFGIVTNIDQVHFGDATITWQEKSKLLTSLTNRGYLPLVESGKLSLHKDSLVLKVENGVVFKTFAFHNKQADIDLIDHEFILDNPSQAGSAGNVLIDDDVIEIVSNSIEVFYLIYAAIGYDIARHLGCSTLKQLPVYIALPPSRATLLEGKNNSIIVDSSYNSSPIGTHHMLDIVQQMRKQLPDYGLICLIGEMRELYDLTESSHRSLANKLIDMNIDYIGLVGESTQQYMFDDLVDVYDEDRVIHNQDSRKLGQWVAELLAQDSKKYIILVKGSQNTIFLEEAIKEFLINSDDQAKLCRQSDWRTHKKHVWFNSIV